MRLPGIIAHRGYSAVAPENTLAALAAALDAGADMIEVDVARSADGELVLIHDEALERTTNGRGLVAARTLAELRRLDAGSWFDPRFAGERLPTLAEALELVRAWAPINLEIKPEAVSRADAGVETLLLATVRDFGLQEEVLVSSFHPLALWRLSKMTPRLPLASLLYPPHHGHKKPGEIVAEVGADALHLADHQVAERLADLQAAARGVPWRVYTVNDAARFRELAAAGVDAVFTDQLERLLAARAELSRCGITGD
jgi:glycerophosphoryl diester phosphodiesterase